jgi:hypothetical protein
MAIVVGVTTIWDDVKKIEVIGTLTFSGSYVAGGDTVNFAHPSIKSSRVPFAISILGQSGYTYVFVPGTDITSGKVKIFPASLTELLAGAYPAGITGDTVIFEGTFPKLL